MLTKSRFAGAALTAFTFFSALSFATEVGRNGFPGNPAVNGGAVCNVCHAPGAAKPTVTLSGPTILNAGQTANYTLSIKGGPGISGGVNISTTDFAGTLAPSSTDLRLFGKDLVHVRPKAFANGMASFSFRWTAPSYNKDVVIYAAGLSSNGLRNIPGDGVGSAKLTVKVQNGGLPPSPPLPTRLVPVALDAYVSGLDNPAAIVHAKDSRLFVVERVGRIRIVKGKGNLLATPFLNIAGRVLSSGGEQGLLGLAFHPDYANNGFFYVYYTRLTAAGAYRVRLSRFSRSSANPDLASPASEVILMEFDHPYDNHNGGDLHFGPDGFLYISSGDGGLGGDPDNHAQNVNKLLGKLLRIDVNGVPGTSNGPDCAISPLRNYRIPRGNAFTDGRAGQGCDEIYALGLRNPWRFSFDRKTGALWIGDVGQGDFEEIDYIPPRSSGGMNLGWRCREGGQPFNTQGCTKNYLAPILAPSHADGNCAITGGYVYRGIEYPALNGRYLFTDFCNSALKTLSGQLSSPTVHEVAPATLLGTPSAFGENSNGELFVASLGQGTIYKVVRP